jgi:ribosomal protein L40E/F0F1-type ATP synthase membrane subunit c/vacuolar-type H+-ATPase subunit K
MAFCTECGAQVGERGTFCGKCGAKVIVSDSHQKVEKRGNSGLAVASLALGIAGLFCLWPCAVLAIVLGATAKGRMERDPSLTGRSMARAGLYLGIAGLVEIILLVIGMLALVFPH